MIINLITEDLDENFLDREKKTTLLEQCGERLDFQQT